MSGMEPLAALGLACNIMQLLSFGGEAISLCRKVYKTGEIDPSLKDYSSQTAKICENLNDSLTQRQPNPGADALALQQRAIVCKAAADKLKHELELLTPTSGASGWKRGFTAPIKAIRHKHQLSELEKDLNNLKSSLDTQLLVKTFDLVDPSKLKTEILAESKGLLATTLQQVASGQQDLSLQMVKALEGAQNRFNSEYLRNQRAIEQQIAATARDLQNERTRVQQEKRENKQRQDWDHLLKSLGFDARTERVNMIRQEYSGTCRWVFEVVPEGHRRIWPCFTTWLQSKDKPIYWISGKPGSGKSTLMKFIASDESSTRDSLKQWQPDVQVLSHYFWLAGSPMQNSIKGFLCSLVYQILSEDISSALTLLESNPDIKRKSCATDWDPTDLRRIFINLILQPGKSFCLFIDGLDELSPEESPRDLIDIITELQSPQVKLCLSSRPEPAMKLYLGHYPTLPMHAFIRDDIRKYTEGILNRAISHRNDALKVDLLVEEVSSGADGVFLWAVLVARSLERGIEKGDSLQLLEERLRQMPKSLSDLYSSMWQRLGDDLETYQKGFSHFMDVMSVAADMTCLRYWRKVTVFELMAATNASFLDQYLDQDEEVSKEELEFLCRDTRNSIEAWSAGLLTVAITPTTGTDAIPFENRRDSGPYCDLEFYTNMTVGYVHQTARDFLLDEAEGQKLWKRVDRSRGDLAAKLVKAALMRFQLWTSGDLLERPLIQEFFRPIHYSGSFEEATYILHNTLPNIEKAIYKGYLSKATLVERPETQSELMARFMVMAANYGFCDYVSRRIKEMQQTGQFKAQDHASLLCAFCSDRNTERDLTNNFIAKERLIQSLLCPGLPSFENLPFFPGFNLSRSLLLRYLVSILEAYSYIPVVEEAVTTLALLWKQASCIQNAYVQLGLWFWALPDEGHTRVTLRIQTSRICRAEDETLVVMRVNLPYLFMAVGSLVHPSLCMPRILSGEEPSAQAILIGFAGVVQDYYEIGSEEESRKITECITPLLHYKYRTGLQEKIEMETTKWKDLEKVLQQIVSGTKPLNDKVDGECDERSRYERVEAAVDEFLNDKVTRLSPPWW